MQKHHSTGVELNATAYVDRARGWSTALEDAEARRQGEPICQVRNDVARKIGVPAGTLQNLRNGRLKAVAVHIYDRLRAGVIRELENEMRRLEHELQILRSTGADPRHGEIPQVEADIHKVRAALGLD